ncbi:MAG: hypothetical protein II965_04830, partial [Pyramidobacter sp.]|nr:hypothetical protein [Pyramidobacter sp.]
PSLKHEQKTRGCAENELSAQPRVFVCGTLFDYLLGSCAEKTVQRRFPFALFLAPRPVFEVFSNTALFKSEKYFSYYSK